MSNIDIWQDKINKCNSLSSDMDGIISACESLYSQLNNSSISLEGNVIGGKSYDNGDLSSSSGNCQTIYATASAIKSACSNKVSELQKMIDDEKARLAELERQRQAAARANANNNSSKSNGVSRPDPPRWHP